VELAQRWEREKGIRSLPELAAVSQDVMRTTRRQEARPASLDRRGPDAPPPPPRTLDAPPVAREDGVTLFSPPSDVPREEPASMMTQSVPDIGQTSLLLDCKSIDPRANLRQPKPEHVFQMHVGMGLVRRATDHQPEYAILSYIDASFWDHITEFPVRFDPRVYDAAIERARSIMAATDPGDLAPEGKIAGGGECRYCAWGQQCVGTTLASMPPGGARLGANAAAELKSLRDAERALAASAEATEYTRAATQEAIKQFLRTAGVRGHKGDNWSVQWTVTKGRQSIDQAALLEAAADAGIQIDEFKKEGKPAERLTVT